MTDAEFPMYHTCAMCGKRFYIGPLIETWTYKKGKGQHYTRWFCGWNCYSQFLKEREKKKK